MTTTSAPTLPPNHHADYEGCSGASGLLVGLILLVGRRGDAELAVELTGAGAGHVVDVGCGPGVAARYVAGKGAHVTGVDPAGVMLAIARRLTKRSAGDVTYLEGAAESLPVGDGEATVVWTIAAAHHWRDLDAGLREARRVLAPGGRFLAIERQARPGATGLASHGWTDQQADAFATLCRDHGFTDVRVEHRRVGRRRRVVAVVATAASPP